MLMVIFSFFNFQGFEDRNFYKIQIKYVLKQRNLKNMKCEAKFKLLDSTDIKFLSNNYESLQVLISNFYK